MLDHWCLIATQSNVWLWSALRARHWKYYIHQGQNMHSSCCPIQVPFSMPFDAIIFMSCFRQTWTTPWSVTLGLSPTAVFLHLNSNMTVRKSKFKAITTFWGRPTNNLLEIPRVQFFFFLHRTEVICWSPVVKGTCNFQLVFVWCFVIEKSLRMGLDVDTCSLKAIWFVTTTSGAQTKKLIRRNKRFLWRPTEHPNTIQYHWILPYAFFLLKGWISAYHPLSQHFFLFWYFL